MVHDRIRSFRQIADRGEQVRQDEGLEAEHMFDTHYHSKAVTWCAKNCGQKRTINDERAASDEQSAYVGQGQHVEAESDLIAEPPVLFPRLATPFVTAERANHVGEQLLLLGIRAVSASSASP